MELKPVFSINPNIDQTTYYWFEHGFTSDEVDKINKDAQKYSFQKAQIVGEDPNNSIRKSNIKWLPYEQQWEWVYDRLMNCINEANNALWNFNLHTVLDNIQYTEYEGNGGHYDWHLDIGPNSINHRKISVVVQLSEPEAYIGGDLELHPGNNSFAVPRKKGAIILFPSFLLHRVTPLTSGLRRSLVLWAGGDHYK
jgi:PKHD-type hydroxylase